MGVYFGTSVQVRKVQAGTEDDALYEDFLGEGVAEIEDVADNEGYAVRLL